MSGLTKVVPWSPKLTTDFCRAVLACEFVYGGDKPETIQKSESFESDGVGAQTMPTQKPTAQQPAKKPTAKRKDENLMSKLEVPANWSLD